MQFQRLHHRADLVRIAIHAMLERGLEPEFPIEIDRQLATISGPGRERDTAIHDLTDLLWCSIDNDDSMDLDQLTASEVLEQGAVRIRVAIADVDALVQKDTPIDAHARTNTTSVYTSARIFPMLPEKLSTDLTSLNEKEDRLAVVTEMVFNPDGSLAGSTVYRALVHNRAKLAYDATSAWLDGRGEMPSAMAAVAGMEEQVRTQDAVAQQVRARRHSEGSLEFETFQPRAVFEGEKVVDIALQEHNRARQLIEELMIATNTCTARFLAGRGGLSLRRVVRSPERWLRIVAVAKDYGDTLPTEPDSVALGAFLAKRRRIDPLRFPDLSLVIVKLMGAGEYVVEGPHGAAIGHFGLALRDYTHSTAPNRRYPDLITLRLIKAALAGVPPPYTDAELATLALHCTRQEDAARKVERQLRKSEAALLLETRIGQIFSGVITGSAAEGVWVRIFSPPAEGKLYAEAPGLAIGDKVQVRLESVSVERGFIDFVVVD
jgi:exoribonuclease-2